MNRRAWRWRPPWRAVSAATSTTRSGAAWVIATCPPPNCPPPISWGHGWPAAGTSVSLFWPADRSWCVATEIDYDSTLVGGSGRLVSDLLATSDLEAWPIAPDDSLQFGADRVNDHHEDR